MPPINDKEKILRAGVAIITGAGSGLGRAMAIEMTRRGVKVCGFGRHASSLKETAALTSGALFVPKVVDVSHEAEVRAAIDEVAASVGPITVLINNAAVYPRRDFLAETPASFMDTIQINLGGVVCCTRVVLDSMVKSGTGRIVNVGSYADVSPIPGSSAYSVSKGAVRILTRALVADLPERFPDIVISTWTPGVLATEMGLPDGLDPAVAAAWGVSLALSHDRTLNGVAFSSDAEVLEPQSLKGRMKDLVTMRKAREPRRLQLS